MDPSLDATNPRIVYAAVWEAYRAGVRLFEKLANLVGPVALNRVIAEAQLGAVVPRV